MSFSFNSLTNNGLPTMHSLMGNIANGGNYISSQLQQSSLLAGLNNSPLEFNLKKNQPPPGAGLMDLETAAERESNKNNNGSLENKQENTQQSLNDKAMQNLGLLQQQHNNEMLFNQMVSMSQQPHQGGFMMMPGMVNMNMMESQLLGMQPFPLMTPQPPDNRIQCLPPDMGQSPTSNLQKPEECEPKQLKEIIYCKSCTLFPPKINSPPPKVIEKPPGCRTVFVGGLPNTITEETIREIFDRCGEITTLRLSKKNFCHIRFVFEASVDSAIYLSGYRLRIGYFQKLESDNSSFGTIHVDYAQARDDQYEYECKQRKLQREMRHREKMEKDRVRPLSPLPVVHFTEHEALTLADKIKNDETFAKAVQILITWLERGDCSKKNSNTFYSMIQSTNSHVRRLINDKNLYEEELARAKEQYRKQTLCMLNQFSQIEKVFNAASHKKVWDHFTKAQRKNIEHWKKQSTEIRSVQLDEIIDDDEMEMSDDDRDHVSNSDREFSSKRMKYDHDHEHKKRTTSESSCGKSADRLSSDSKSEIEMKSLQIQVLQETIRNLQTQLLDNKAREVERMNRISELEDKLKDANVRQLLLKTKIANGPNCKSNTASSSKGSEIDENEINDLMHSSPQHLQSQLDMQEAKIVSLVSTFLAVHPFGASIDYIWSYVSRFALNIKAKELEGILVRYENLFNEETTGVGAKIERNWKFCGFEIDSDD